MTRQLLHGFTESPPGIDYHCARCSKRITSYTATVRDDGKLDITGSCHCDGVRKTFTVTLFLGIGGIVFER